MTRSICRMISLLGILCCAFVHAAGAGEVVGLPTRSGVTVPLFEVWNPNAVATVVLYSGGGGGYGQLNAQGWPGSGNFLIRTGQRWASHPFNLVMVGRASDGMDLQNGQVRVSDEHTLDNIAIFKSIKARSTLPIWVVGTSMGTISTASAAIHDDEKLLAGIVLTSSITSYRVGGVVQGQALDKIRVPTLVVHHAKDSCKNCTPYEAKNIAPALTNAPFKEFVLVDNGSGAIGNPCEAFHYHGYIGAENEVVDMISDWILKHNL